MNFENRMAAVPRLGIGVSTEYGAFSAPNSLDIHRLRREYPEFAGFLEVGVEIHKGLDEDAIAWATAQLPTTYHFLDINLDDPDSLSPWWISQTKVQLEQLNAAWMCGDAGLWHMGPREPGSMMLLPPISALDAVVPMAEGIQNLRETLGIEVFPENPPGSVYLGPLHLLDFYGRVVETADTGMVLDCAHLAIYQRQKGYAACTALDGFPMHRIIELHVAGARVGSIDGLEFVEDDHTPTVLPETWEILEWVIPRAPNLKAVVFECERNPLEDTLAGFERIAATWKVDKRAVP